MICITWKKAELCYTFYVVILKHQVCELRRKWMIYKKILHRDTPESFQG